jgi:hypothetical protein
MFLSCGGVLDVRVEAVGDESAGEAGLSSHVIKVCDGEPKRDHGSPITAGDVDVNACLVHVLGDLILEAEVMHVTALERVDAVVDAEVVVEVQSLVLVIGASEPSALDLGRLLSVGAVLLKKLPSPSDAEDDKNNDGEEEDGAHVCCLGCGVVWWFKGW